MTNKTNESNPMINALKEIFELGKKKAKKSPKGVGVDIMNSIEKVYYSTLIRNFVGNINDEHIEEFNITELELKNIEKEFAELFNNVQEIHADIESSNYMDYMRYEAFRDTLNKVSKGAYNYLSALEAHIDTEACEKMIKEFRNEIADLGGEFSVTDIPHPLSILLILNDIIFC